MTTDCIKVRHLSRRHAKRAAKLMAKRFRGEKFNVYRCEPCNCWHVGHMPDSKRYGNHPVRLQ